MRRLAKRTRKLEQTASAFFVDEHYLTKHSSAAFGQRPRHMKDRQNAHEHYMAATHTASYSPI